MSPFHEAQLVYQREPCKRDFWTDLHMHLCHGYVFSTPESFIMGRAVCHVAEYSLITDPAHRFATPDAWLVYLVAGSGLRDFFRYEPYRLPLIGWERNNKLRWYSTEVLKRKIL